MGLCPTRAREPRYKNSTKKNQHTDAILYNQASQICACVESCGKVQGHFLWDPGPINATISSQKNWFCYLNLPVTLYLGSKKVGYMINKWQFCATKLARKANYASGAFFGKYMKILLVKTNYAKNYASTIYSKARERGEREPSPPDPQIARVLVLFSRRPYYLCS